jgi:hypothetical protein
MKWVTEISAWLMSAQAIVLTIIQTLNVALPGRQFVIVLLILGLFTSTLTITGAVNYVVRGSKYWMKVAQLTSNLTVWFFLTGLAISGVLVILNE